MKISGIYFFSALNLIFALPFYTKLIYQFICTYLCICAYMYVLDVDNLKQFFCCDFFSFCMMWAYLSDRNKTSLASA